MINLDPSSSLPWQSIFVIAKRRQYSGAAGRDNVGQLGIVLYLVYDDVIG